MGKASRDKGKTGEREAAACLRDLGFPGARRGVQYHGLEGEDVVGAIPGAHCEVKRTERLTLYSAMEQAIADAGEAIPFLMHRRSRRPWLVVLRAEDLVRFARLVVQEVEVAEMLE